MFNSANGGYSLADIAAATGDSRTTDDTFGGNGAWWIIILFLFVFCGWGNNGWGNGNGAQGALTRADLCQDMNFSDLENAARGIQNGLCDGFYAQNTNMLTGFSNIQNSLTNGFAGVNNAVCSLGYQTQDGVNTINVAGMQNTNALQQAINTSTTGIQQDIAAMNVANMQNTNALQTQLADCCCKTQSSIKDAQYQLATDTCAIQNTIQNTTRDVIDNQNANTKSILDFIVNDKLATLQAENQSLRLAASQAAQNQYLISELRPSPIPAYAVSNPYCNYNPIGYGCGAAAALA